MNDLPQNIQQILSVIQQSNSFAVVGHIRPDGDCIGSQLAMTGMLRSLGKNVVCWNSDETPQKYAFLDVGHWMQKPRPGCEFDCVIAVDCATVKRLGECESFIQQRKTLINIDHHESNSRYGDINWIDAESPSTAELVLKLFNHGRWDITPDLADSLFTAVSTDTGSFQYPSTLPSTYYAAGDLVRRGANLGRICEKVYHSYPLSRVKLLQYVFNHFKLTYKNQIGYFWLKPSDFARTGCHTNDSEGLIDHVRAIDTVIVACLFEEMETSVFRVSLRSKSDRINVNEIAATFGGGGHVAAAGARIRGGTPQLVQRRVLSAIKKAMISANF
jgi:phosphoesterase RecJ-like protein